MRPSRVRHRGLTELEGTILAAVRRERAVTPYKLRQAFQDSPSVEWSGSAGAVYPAMRRLKAASLLSAKGGGDGRGTAHYSLTKAGVGALVAWAGDTARAASAGSDPFRSRAPEWLILDGAARERMLEGLARTLQARCRALKRDMAKADRIARAQLALELDLQRARLRWIAAHKRR